MTRYQLHVTNWAKCTACELSLQRRQVVNLRGKLPCSVLFIGEAPGESEDVLGTPFVGPAGKLFDQIIRDGINHPSIPFALCNLVGCFPKEGKKTGDHAPPDTSIKACSPRLKELIAMARPELIVCVGSLATKWVRKLSLGLRPDAKIIDLVHPAAILRSSVVQQEMAIRQCVVRIKTAVEDLIPF